MTSTFIRRASFVIAGVSLLGLATSATAQSARPVPILPIHPPISISPAHPTLPLRPNLTLNTKQQFVRGSVAATFLTQRERLKQIRLPNARVFAVRANNTNVPLGSAVTDLSGRFLIKLQQSGSYILCVEADGIPRYCAQKPFTTVSPATNYGTFALPVQSKVGAIAYGTVQLQDGNLPRGFDPVVGINRYAIVELVTRKAVAFKAYVNNFGEYIIPEIPTKEPFQLIARIDKQTAESGVSGQKALEGIIPGHAYEFDMVFLNSAPRLRLLTVMEGDKPVQIATPGSTIRLNAVSYDAQGDKLQFRWLLPNGKIIGPTNDAALEWQVPNKEGSYLFSVMVNDERGGFARRGIKIHVSNGKNVTFSGIVVDVAGQPIAGAQIDVNHRLTNTNAQGRFKYGVPMAEKYIMNIRRAGLQTANQPSYGTASFVYTNAIRGGRWVLRNAQVVTVDPTQNPNQPIVLQQKRSERDCRGPATSQITWPANLTPGLFQWQDGRGNITALADLGSSNPKRIQNIMHLIARMNPALLKSLADATKVPPRIDPPRVPCTPGIKVEIPPNSLVDLLTNQAPNGPVQIALSSVSLNAPDEMPGDYTAVDGNGKSVSMESFGAGSIEIGAGASRFNLKPGTLATVTIPVDGTQLAGGASMSLKIPFLYYDENNGIWRQDGEADLVGLGANSAYVKKVSHFSTMNADILKTGESCVAVEVDASLPTPFDVEVVMQPSLVNPGVIQVRTLHVDGPNNVIYNLPNGLDIVLTPIINGPLPDGDVGPVPAGVFVVNTGGPQNSGTKPPNPNPDGTYYGESGGNPTGPCASRVILEALNPVSPQAPDEFLQGFFFQSTNINEFLGTNVETAIDDGVVEYYNNADPLQLRNSMNLFLSKNRFGQPTAAGELEVSANFANGGDLGFGRAMHCRRNQASDGQLDYACYVTNFNQPPANIADQQDAEDTVTPNYPPDATVAMEYSRVELNDPNNFPDNTRAVKFYVYNTNTPDDPPLRNADLDGHGARPIPQLCMVCHGGFAATTPADVNLPTGPTKGAFSSRTDILDMHSNFLPFDLHFFKFPASQPKNDPAVQAAFKSLNVDIVRGVAAANGAAGAPIVDVIDNSLYFGGSATQIDDKVVPGWDTGNNNAPPNRFYRDVFGRACRTCHIASPFGAPTFQTRVAFEAEIASVQDLVCRRRIMPHAQRTNDWFWNSLNPNMAAYLQLYGQTLPDWSNADNAQCGQFQGGGQAPSLFTAQIYPILQSNCVSCHSTNTLANFTVGNIANTYNSLFNDTKDGLAKYIVPNNPGSSRLYGRITTGGAGTRMPLGGPDLVASDTDNPADGVNDAPEVNSWIVGGAPGP